MLSKSILIKQKALSLGFSACGIAPAMKLENEEQRLKDYLENNFNGTMGYMDTHFEKRLDPKLLVPGARSIVVVLMNYFPQQLQPDNNIPIVSKYAYGKDYHLVVKDRLNLLLNFINSEITLSNGRAFTDSAPVLERAWAVRAGLGWIGKNGLLINKGLGSFLFIGELIIDFELEYDSPYENEFCGSCNKCLNACPTKALVEPYILDARRCISYLTIESKEDIPVEFKPMMTNQIFGCDICQDVCPWNRDLKSHITPEFQPNPDFLKLDKQAWSQLDKTTFTKLFNHTAIKRSGFEKLKMNIDNVIPHQLVK